MQNYINNEITNNEIMKRGQWEHKGSFRGYPKQGGGAVLSWLLSLAVLVLRVISPLKLPSLNTDLYWPPPKDYDSSSSYHNYYYTTIMMIITLILILLMIIIVIFPERLPKRGRGRRTVQATRACRARQSGLHPVSITRFLLGSFSPGAGLLKHLFVRR